MIKDKSQLKIEAHRGASAYAPENTLESFALAVKMGADGVELDTQLTRDGELVVCHDERIDRMSDGIGYVKDFTLAELRRFNFNAPHPEGHPRVTIPTLKEVYELLKPSNLTVNVELKTGIFEYPGIEEKVLTLTEDCGMKGRVHYSSFNHYSLRRLREIDPKAEIGILYGDVIIDVHEYGREKLAADALHPPIPRVLFDPEYMKKAEANGEIVRVWTVDQEEYMRMLVDMGVDCLITNVPDVAIALFR